MQIIHTSLPKSRKSKSSRLAKLNAEHSAYIQSFLVNRPSPVKIKTEKKPVTSIPLSDSIPGPAYKKSVDDYKWKRDREESKETIEEIERKKKRIAPAYNKGGYAYISDETDPTTLGRKI